MLLAITWWVVLLAGLIPAAYLLFTYRPARWRKTPALIIRGLAAVVCLSYLRPAVLLATSGWVPTFRSGFQIGWSYVMCAATDVIVLLLLRLLLRYRKAYARQMMKENDG